MPNFQQKITLKTRRQKYTGLVGDFTLDNIFSVFFLIYMSFKLS